MPVCHVLYTPTNHDLAQVQISLDNNVERSFSVLIHKSVENDMGPRAYLWSDLDLRFVSFYKSNYIAEKMDAEWLQKHGTKPCSAKSRINGNQYSIHLHLWYTYETIIVNEAQVPPTGLLCEV